MRSKCPGNSLFAFTAVVLILTGLRAAAQEGQPDAVPRPDSFQDRGRPEPPQPDSRGFNSVNLSRVINSRITNEQGQELGTIRDIAIDSRRGRAAFAIVSPSGSIGQPDEMFVVPWGMVHPAGDGTVRMNLPDNRFPQAARFSERDFSLLGDRTFATELHRAFGQRPFWEDEIRAVPPSDRTVPARDMDTGRLSLVRGSELRGQRIMGQRNEPVGSISEVVMDSRTGRMAFPVVSAGEFLGTTDDHIAVPWRQIDFAEDGTLRSNFSRDRLRDAPRFDRTRPTDLQFVNRVNEFFGEQPFEPEDRTRRTDGQRMEEGDMRDARDRRQDRDQPQQPGPQDQPDRRDDQRGQRDQPAQPDPQGGRDRPDDRTNPRGGRPDDRNP